LVVLAVVGSTLAVLFLRVVVVAGLVEAEVVFGDDAAELVFVLVLSGDLVSFLTGAEAFFSTLLVSVAVVEVLLVVVVVVALFSAAVLLSCVGVCFLAGVTGFDALDFVLLSVVVVEGLTLEDAVVLLLESFTVSGFDGYFLSETVGVLVFSLFVAFVAVVFEATVALPLVGEAGIFTSIGVIS
jgi:hypothetical protein